MGKRLESECIFARLLMIMEEMVATTDEMANTVVVCKGNCDIS